MAASALFGGLGHKARPAFGAGGRWFAVALDDRAGGGDGHEARDTDLRTFFEDEVEAIGSDQGLVEDDLDVGLVRGGPLGDDVGGERVAGDRRYLNFVFVGAALGEDDVLADAQAEGSTQAMGEFGAEGDVTGAEDAAGDEESAELIRHAYRGNRSKEPAERRRSRLGGYCPDPDGLADAFE